MDEINTSFAAYSQETFETMGKIGLLLVSGDAKNSNVMAIGWGTAGIIWGKPIFIVLVRPSRYTFGFIEKQGEFTVNVPGLDMEEIVTFCGTASGRNCNKFKEKNLTLLSAKKVASPIIKQCKIFYECRVVHRNNVISAELAPDLPSEFYPEGDYHRVYFGEILAVYKK